MREFAARIDRWNFEELQFAFYVCEIEYGLAKRDSARLRQQVGAIMTAIPVLDLPSDIASHYGQIRAALERQGPPIGPNDLLIAAHGVAADITVVTGYDREFRRVAGLNVKNWLRPSAD